MSIESKIKSWEKKIISKSELEKILFVSSETELYDLVSKAVGDGLLSPVKSSGTNGNLRYPIYMKYRITSIENFSDTISEIAMFHPALTENGYLQSHPNTYLKNKLAFQKLNRYLFSKQSNISVSKKERSFLIFGEEKKLDDRAFCNLLGHIGLTQDFLKYYETPEYCFNDYIPKRKDSMILLICENKDIWFNIRRRMYEDGADEIFNTHIDGVVYGCGNRISESRSLSEYTRFMGSKAVRYLYWGDIDRAGFNIYLSLVKNNPKIDIQFFTAAYMKMIMSAEDIVIPDSDDHRGIVGNYDEIYELFPYDYRQKLIHYINDNKRIPQEIINYERLLTDMRRSL